MFQFKNSIFLKRSFPRMFRSRSCYLELLSNILEKYPKRSLFCTDVWLINEPQSHMVLLFQLPLNETHLEVVKGLSNQEVSSRESTRRACRGNAATLENIFIPSLSLLSFCYLLVFGSGRFISYIEYISIHS